MHTGIMTSTVDMREDAGGRPIQKAKVDCECSMSLEKLRYMLLDALVIMYTLEEYYYLRFCYFNLHWI